MISIPQANPPESSSVDFRILEMERSQRDAKDWHRLSHLCAEEAIRRAALELQLAIAPRRLKRLSFMHEISSQFHA